MFGLVKAQKLTEKANVIIAQTNKALDELMQSGESADQMLNRLGVSRQQALDAILADDEVESCREDLRAAMLAQAWRIYGDDLNEEDSDRLWRMVQRHLPVLAEIALTAKLNGYAVGMYVYEQDENGYYVIKNVINRAGSIGKFKIKADGKLYEDDNEVNSQVLYLPLVNRPTDTRPSGEMTAARLYPAVCLRKQGFLYAAQFITRYAQPYLIGKDDSTTDGDHRGFVARLFGLINGGAMSLNREDDIQLLQNSADGQAFKRLENLANARIQKLLLGKVRTSDLETGSRAAQETEEKARGDRIDGYLALLAQGIQHLIDAVLLVNMAWGKTIHAPKGVWFEWQQEEQIDLKRAERDKIYLESGAIRFTPEYFRDIVGYTESHFELVEQAKTDDKTNAKKLSTKLSGRDYASSELGKMQTAEQIIMQPKMQAILSALNNSQDYAEFERKLSGLDLSDGDTLLIQRLVGDGVNAWLNGWENE